MKKLIKNYTFNAAAKTVTFSDYAAIEHEGILLITNVVDGALLYNFADPALGGTVAGNVLTLEFDTTAMSNTDGLMVYYDDADVLPATIDSVETLQSYIQEIQNLAQQISFLSTVRGIASDLRVTLLSGTLSTLSTVTTVTTVTTVSTVTNLANIGGYSSTPMMQNQQNQTAIQSNINNVIVS